MIRRRHSGWFWAMVILVGWVVAAFALPKDYRSLSHFVLTAAPLAIHYDFSEK